MAKKIAKKTAKRLVKKAVKKSSAPRVAPPTLHQVMNALDRTESRVIAYRGGADAEKAKILKTLSLVRNKLGILCRSHAFACKVTNGLQALRRQ